MKGQFNRRVAFIDASDKRHPHNALSADSSLTKITKISEQISAKQREVHSRYNNLNKDVDNLMKEHHKSKAFLDYLVRKN